MIPRSVRPFLDRVLRERRDPVDQAAAEAAQVVRDGLVTSNDGRFVDAVVNGRTADVGTAVTRVQRLRMELRNAGTADAELRQQLRDARRAYGRASDTIGAERARLARWREQVRLMREELNRHAGQQQRDATTSIAWTELGHERDKLRRQLGDIGEAIAGNRDWDPDALAEQVRLAGRLLVAYQKRRLSELLRTMRAEREEPAEDDGTLTARCALLAAELGEHAKSSRPTDPDDSGSIHQDGYCDGLADAARRLQALLPPADGTRVEPGQDRDRWEVLGELLHPAEVATIRSGQSHPDAVWTPDTGWTTEPARSE